MPLYVVHEYPIGMVTHVAVEADSPEEAVDEIMAATDSEANFTQSKYADDCDGYLVDEVDAVGQLLESYALGPDGRQERRRYSMNDRQHAMILAALRYYRQNGRSSFPAPAESDIWDIATNGGKFSALDDAEIDSLCEELNFGG